MRVITVFVQSLRSDPYPVETKGDRTMGNLREPRWPKMLAACCFIALLVLTVTVRTLVFLPSRGGSAVENVKPAVAATPQCATRQVRMSCFRDDSGSPES